jgi:hypothetical protein
MRPALSLNVKIAAQIEKMMDDSAYKSSEEAIPAEDQSAF